MISTQYQPSNAPLKFSDFVIVCLYFSQDGLSNTKTDKEINDDLFLTC